MRVNYHQLTNKASIFKKGVKVKRAYYRSISFTTVPSKCMEFSIRGSILDHLLRNDLLNIKQHGFMFKKSCFIYLIESLGIITDALEWEFEVDEILLDFVKAFDMVICELLILTLLSYQFDKE